MTRHEAIEQEYFKKHPWPPPEKEPQVSKKFSILFPTRERPELLRTALNSIKGTVGNVDEIEVLIAVDSDDTATWDFLAKNKYLYDFLSVNEVPRSRDLNFSRDYYNHLFKKSTGEWVIPCNDDVAFRTGYWDIASYEVLKDKPRVIYGWIDDNLGANRAKGHGEYCCFPCFGRLGCEILGGVFPDRIPNWGADIYARKLYDNVGSVVRLPMKIEHFSSHNGTRECDHINRRISQNQTRYDVRPTYEEINLLLAALKGEQNRLGAERTVSA